MMNVDERASSTSRLPASRAGGTGRRLRMSRVFRRSPPIWLEHVSSDHQVAAPQPDTSRVRRLVPPQSDRRPLHPRAIVRRPGIGPGRGNARLGERPPRGDEPLATEHMIGINESEEWCARVTGGAISDR